MLAIKPSCNWLRVLRCFIFSSVFFNMTWINVTYADIGCSYKSFNDYINLIPTKSSQPQMFRAHFKAQENINDRQPDSAYKDNQWHLIMRHGLYRAQVDKAISEIDRYFMGYGTDVDIVQDNNDYYLARRDLTHFTRWNEALRYEQDGTYTINGYILHPDGTLTKKGIIKKFKGLASLAYLNGFFANADANDFNYGVQETDNEIRVIVFDNEASFQFGDENKNAMEDGIDAAIKEMPWYISERKAIIQKLTEDTNFFAIKAIITKNVTGTSLDESRWILNHRDQATWLSQEEIASAEKWLSTITPEEEQEAYGVSHIIDVLENKHAELTRMSQAANANK